MSVEPRQAHPDLRAKAENLDPTLYELSTNDSSKFQAIKRTVWDEMIRRYADNPEKIEELDNGLLHRLFVEVTKVDYALGRGEKQENPNEAKTSILDIVNNPGLPPERRAEILESAKVKLRADLELLESIEEAVNDDLAALPQ